MMTFARSMAIYAQRNEIVVGALWMHFSLAHVPGLANDWETWKSYTRMLLIRCDRLRVIMVDGWDKSAGVKDEIALAYELEIFIEYVKPEPDAY